MTIKQLSENFSVSGELSEQDFSTLKELGVNLVINVRPDNESSEQVSNEDYQVISRAHSIEYVFMPVKPCEYTDANIKKMQALLQSTDGRVHSFCRTGARAAHLWALTNKQELSYEDLQEIVAQHGYDLSPIAPRFK
ncbi:MAG: TIGR01244 family sulfur transferase [Glaciecola sp.]|jgi:sulfide:quinone oxidoreductase